MYRKLRLPKNSYPVTYSRRKSNKLLFLIPLLGRRTAVLDKKETNHIKFDLFQARASRVGALPTNTKKQQFEVPNLSSTQIETNIHWLLYEAKNFDCFGETRSCQT